MICVICDSDSSSHVCGMMLLHAHLHHDIMTSCGAGSWGHGGTMRGSKRPEDLVFRLSLRTFMFIVSY